jgi:hypothetical protein
VFVFLVVHLLQEYVKGPTVLTNIKKSSELDKQLEFTR